MRTASRQHDPDAEKLERELCAAAAEVLRLERVEPTADIFALGAHSLSVMQISARVHERLGVEVPVASFYDEPALREVAETTAWMLAAKAAGD